MIHEIKARVPVDTLINIVLTFNKKVKTKMQIIAADKIRIVLWRSGVVSHPPNRTGITGSTHGARTERIPEKNEIKMISIERVEEKEYDRIVVSELFANTD